MTAALANLRAVITLDVDPQLHFGPLSIAWHGLMIAIGIGFGGLLARRYARDRGLAIQPLLALVTLIALAGIVGSRLFYLLLNDPSGLVQPGTWIGTRGFAFYGALIVGTLAVGVYIVRARLDLRYLDALAAGFPLGMAVGRIGDVISGEHYGPATTVPWGFRYLNPHAEVPGSALAYHQGGFYELMVALVMLAVTWPLRHRFRRPTMLLWTVVAMYGVGRFVIFFWRSDTAGFDLGINAAQATSIALVAFAAGGAWAARRRAVQRPLAVA